MLKRFGDIRECGERNLEPVDVICGGFPCQDISNAGKRVGSAESAQDSGLKCTESLASYDPSSSSWENVAALLGRGIGRVLGDLSEDRV